MTEMVVLSCVACLAPGTFLSTLVSNPHSEASPTPLPPPPTPSNRPRADSIVYFGWRDFNRLSSFFTQCFFFFFNLLRNSRKGSINTCVPIGNLLPVNINRRQHENNFGGFLRDMHNVNNFIHQLVRHSQSAHTVHYTFQYKYHGYTFSGMHPFIHSINSTVYSELSTEAVIGQRRRGNSSSPVQFCLKRGNDGEFHRRGMGSSLVEELRCCMSSCSQKKKKATRKASSILLFLPMLIYSIFFLL